MSNEKTNEAPSKRPETPLEHNLHGIHLRHEDIACICRWVLPSSELMQWEELSSEQSFNNRVYFATLKIVLQETEFLLDIAIRVCGRPFGTNKIHNEVASLLLIEQYCALIPAPKVLGWSEDRGAKLRKLNRSIEPNSAFNLATAIEESKGFEDSLGSGQDWIVTTKLPGQQLKLEGLNSSNRTFILSQLAAFMKSWRWDIPEPQAIGNLRFLIGPQAAGLADVIPQPMYRSFSQIQIEGFIDHPSLGESPRSAKEYYAALLRTALYTLKHDLLYSSVRPQLYPLLDRFMQNSLHQLPFPTDFNTSQRRITFTHHDLSPKNILISHTPPYEITGILDFEFAGFFPAEEEFLSVMVDNDGDWSQEELDILLEQLELQGVPTPKAGLKHGWEQITTLYNVITNAAPWWMREGLEKELREASTETVKNIEQLEEILTSRIL